MKVVVVGATGNTGTSVIDALAEDDRVDSVIGVARRVPSLKMPKTEWVCADITKSDLEPVFAGSDAVIHLAWLIQPSHNTQVLRKTNITGSERVFYAAARAGVKNLLYASSIGAYSPGPKDRFIDEGWPVNGVLTSFYSRHKAQVEGILDLFEKDHPEVRVVRLRKALIFKAGAASEARRLFLGPLVPSALLNPKLIPLFPDVGGIRIQAVHSLDVGQAYRLALFSDAAGPFNIAAEPIVEPARIAGLVGARPVPLSPRFVRAAAYLTWKLRLQPTPPGWLDMGLRCPLMDCSRARTELGWEPKFTAEEAVLELLKGMARSDGIQTPPLAPSAGGPMRIQEFLSGVGQRP